MSDDAQTWAMIHAERKALAGTIEGLTPEQWQAPSRGGQRLPADVYGGEFPVGGKKRIRGLRLVSTDTGWSYGAGPEVSGPAMSLLLAMTGRVAGLDGLSGEGATALGQRLTVSA